VFHGFGQAKIHDCGSVLGLNPFSILPQLPPIIWSIQKWSKSGQNWPKNNHLLRYLNPWHTLYHYNLIYFNWFTNFSPELTWRDVQHLVVWSSTIDSVMHNPGVNFINILQTTFSFESALHCFSLITVWLCNFFGARISVQKMLIKCWRNWLQDGIPTGLGYPTTTGSGSGSWTPTGWSRWRPTGKMWTCKTPASWSQAACKFTSFEKFTPTKDN